MRKIIFIFGVLVLFGCNQTNTLFESLAPAKTGIYFSNNIEESDTFNILESQYLYNGGGVGVGDFNNDGLQDLFFTGNHVDNQLYLNEGNLKFNDVTEAAKVASSGFWSSGVSVVDINTDGKLDIYVNNTTHRDSTARINQLYINQGNNEEGIPVFSEEAAAYGLDVSHYTVNSAFFDYDNDGDLDVFIIINQQGDVRGTIAYQNRDQRERVYQRIDKLFRNDTVDGKDHPVFTEVTEEAGITEPGFSLGVNITDINKDGWKDIYISNDFISDDVIYVNNGDGTFTNNARQYLKHTSHSAMGNDVADINNDGFDDIIALDMLPEDNYRQKRMLGPNNYTSYINNLRYDVSFQYARNSLQLNPGNQGDDQFAYSEISLMSGISATDWSWSPLVADFDQDGSRDIIITNGFPKDVTDKDFMDYKADAARFAPKDVLLAKIPSVKIPNYAYRNKGDLTFENVGEDWGITENTFSNGAAYVDLDNDGDLDVVVNNIDQPASVLRNTQNDRQSENHNWIAFDLKGDSNNPDAIGAQIIVKTSKGDIQYNHTIYRGYISSQERRAYFGLGDGTVNEVIVEWPSGKKCIFSKLPLNVIHNIDINECVAGVDQSNNENRVSILTEIKDFEKSHQELDFIDYNIQPLLPFKLSQFGPAMSVGDVNDDGLEDIYVSGPAFVNGYFLMQDTNGGFNADTLKSINPNLEELGTLLMDVDGDNDLDMYVVSGSYEFSKGDSLLQDQLLINQNGKFINSSTSLPKFYSNGICARAADYDRDGDLDIFVGGRVTSGEYPSPVNSYLLNNSSTSDNSSFSFDQSEVLDNLGMVTDALWSDYNNDGWIDLIVAREYESILILENQKGNLVKKEIDSDKKGFWCSLAAGDVDNDGDIDYILGNRGGNVFNEISAEYPYMVYVNDFDKNDNTDAVPMAYFKNKEGEMDVFPIASRVDLSKEINATRKKYGTFEIYAQVNRDILFSDSTLAKTDVYEANYTASSIMINNGNGDFDIQPLNVEAQVAPIFGMVVQDVDGDHNLDIMMVGNDFGNELMYGRMDALNGLVLKGNGNGTFEALKAGESGFYVPGDGKSLVAINNRDRQLIVAGENMGKIRFFGYTKNEQRLDLNSNEYKVIIELSDKSITKEIGYGTGFLSQSSRSFSVPRKAKSLTIISFDGSERKITLGG